MFSLMRSSYFFLSRWYLSSLSLSLLLRSRFSFARSEDSLEVADEGSLIWARRADISFSMSIIALFFSLIVASRSLICCSDFPLIWIPGFDGLEGDGTGESSRISELSKESSLFVGPLFMSFLFSGFEGTIVGSLFGSFLSSFELSLSGDDGDGFLMSFGSVAGVEIDFTLSFNFVPIFLCYFRKFV